MVNAKEIESAETESPAGTRVFWLPAVLLFFLAILLRWVRLDFMSFTYDHAAIARRAMEIHSGRFPFTGIVNSLGFRNGPGYVWSMLPVFLFTSSPMIAAAWHGLLSSTIVFPLAKLGQNLRGGIIGWLPAVLGAVLPAMVFAGRDLWAQHLLAPLAAWGLFFLIRALDQSLPLKHRAVMAGSALAIMAWAVSVHFGGIPCFLLCALAIFPLVRPLSRQSIKLLLPAVVICATMMPSFADFIRRQSDPLPKPIYVEQVEAQQQTLPMPARLIEAARSSMANDSDKTWPWVADMLSDTEFMLLRVFDAVIMMVLLGSLICVMLRILRQKNWADIRRDPVPLLLIVWMFLPAIIAGLFLQRSNPSYFAASLPAGWLCVLFLPAVAPRWQWIGRMVTMAFVACTLAGGAAISAFMIRDIVRSESYIPGYYQPYARQLEVTRYLATKVSSDRLIHLGGPIFEEPYKYLLTYEAKASANNDIYALIQDVHFARQSQERLQLLTQSGAQVGPMLVVLQPTKGSAEIFKRRYYDLPLDTEK